MKNLQSYMIPLLIILFLSGCRQKQAVETDMTPCEIAEVMAESQPELPDFRQISLGDEAFTSYISDYYLLANEQVEDGVICYADGVEASEIAVLVLADEKAPESV